MTYKRTTLMAATLLLMMLAPITASADAEAVAPKGCTTGSTTFCTFSCATGDALTVSATGPTGSVVDASAACGGGAASCFGTSAICTGTGTPATANDPQGKCDKYSGTRASCGAGVEGAAIVLAATVLDIA